MLRAVLTSHISASVESATEFCFQLQTTLTSEARERSADRAPQSHCTVVKHCASQHVLWKGKQTQA